MKFNFLFLIDLNVNISLIIVNMELMNKKLKINQSAERIRPKNSEVERLLSDNKKASQILNWKPKFAGFDGLKRGLNKTIKWFDNENNIKLYKSNIFNF